ncbi:MAG TPA: Rap1a/Tai family immunity protein [Rhizomicrobium sp.]
MIYLGQRDKHLPPRGGAVVATTLGVFVLLTFSSFSVFGDEVAYEYAGDLSNACNSTDAHAAVCAGIIGATLEILANKNRVYGLVACVPRKTTLNKAIYLTKKWMHDHPQEQVRPASFVVARALATSFACN